MTNKTVLMINNIEDDTVGIVNPIDENTVEIVWDEDTKETLTLEEFDVLMQNPNFEITEEVIEEDTPAQDSIKTHKTADVKVGQEADNNSKTRFDMMRSLLGNLADMDMTTLVKHFDDQQAMIGGEAARAGLDGNAAKNASTIKMHTSAEGVEIKLDKENQDAIFGESELTEEVKTKMATLFEAAVSAKVIDSVIKIQEDYDSKLEAHITEIKSELVESLDTYMNHVATKWLSENEVAIESSLKLEMFNEFMEGLHTLMVDHYVDLPDEKVDVLEKAVNENEELNNKLNEEINKGLALEKTINELKKASIVSTMSEGLTLVQKDKLKKLTESTEYTDEENFKKSVGTIKENFLKEKAKDSNILTEVVTEEIPNAPKSSSDSRVNRIADVLNVL